MNTIHHIAAVQQTAATDAALRERIISFWFKREEPMQVWFGASPSFDAAIKQAFGASMEAAARGDFDHWQKSPEGTLALLILLDQFPRNVFRGDKRAFATDARALLVALRAIAQGFDRRVPLMQQLFFYLPLEHDEDLLSQVACVALVEGLLARAQPQEKKMAQAFLDFALRHQAAVLAHGRFPFRNQALGRVSTDAERAFLQQHPTGF